MNRISAIIVLTLLGFVPLQAQTSSAEQGPINLPAPTAAAPIWGKLVMTDNTVTCYYGTGTSTPKTWTQIGQPQTINFLNNPVLVGLYIASHNNAALSTGTVDNVSITPTPTYRLQDGDIGAPSLMGMANFMGGVWTLIGSGGDIWGTSDQCNFQPWLVWGDCTIVCRVTSISPGDTWQKIGIMIRDGYNSGSDYALFCATEGQGVAFQYRSQFVVNPDGTTVPTLVAPTTSSSAGVALGVTPIGSNSSYFVLRP